MEAFDYGIQLRTSTDDFTLFGASVSDEFQSLIKEHLLVSKALPIFLAPHYFCACSDLSLLCEAYDFSSQSEV